ncbi:MAG: FAD-dependent oxidoreductase, partial [Euryarchaeota archaeon]|nr:FAD-dependent oxidoreductase [Euryarchaeota archaeon]
MAIPKVVVVGGGFGGLEALFNLRARLGRQAEFTLVSDRDHFLFKPNTIYIPFGKDPQDLRVPLSEPCRRKGINFVLARVEGIDPKAKTVKTRDLSIPYDHLVLGTGSSMRPEELPGLAQHANTIWTVEEMLRLRSSFSGVVDRARQGESPRVVFLVPPNNKCSGPLYEMVFMLDTWLRRKGVR